MTERDSKQPDRRGFFGKLVTISFLTAGLIHADKTKPVDPDCQQTDEDCGTSPPDDGVDQDCGGSAGSNGEVNQDNDCNTTNSRDDDCGLTKSTDSGGTNAHQDTYCFPGGSPMGSANDLDCGARGELGTHLDNDCSSGAKDNDCGIQFSNGDGDCAFQTDQDCAISGSDEDCAATKEDKDCWSPNPQTGSDTANSPWQP